VAERYFTVDEANGLLEAVSPLAEQMVDRRRRLGELLTEQEQVQAVVGTNGGGLKPQAVVELHRRIEDEATEVARCIEDIHELGGVVKDVDTGLIDFPSLRDGEEILLCWQLGGDEIGYWHSLEGGFTGRQPL
jgi:hypothetical protein